MPRRYRRKRFRGKANLALKIAKKNRSMLKEREKKRVDVNAQAYTTITHTTGTIVYLSPIQQGLDVVNRIGDEVQSQSLHIKLIINNDNTDAASKAACTKFVVFRKRQHINQVPTMSGSATSDLLAQSTPLSSMSPRNLNKYHILHEEKFIGSPESADAYVRDIFLNLKGMKNHYLDTTANTAGAGEGSLWCGFMTDVAANAPEYKLYSRYTFTDA